MSACKRAECSRNYTNAGNMCRARDRVFNSPLKTLLSSSVLFLRQLEKKEITYSNWCSFQRELDDDCH